MTPTYDTNKRLKPKIIFEIFPIIKFQVSEGFFPKTSCRKCFSQKNSGYITYIVCDFEKCI